MMKLPFLPLTAALLVLGELTYVICLAAAASWMGRLSFFAARDGAARWRL